MLSLALEQSLTPKATTIVIERPSEQSLGGWIVARFSSDSRKVNDIVAAHFISQAQTDGGSEFFSSKIQPVALRDLDYPGRQERQRQALVLAADDIAKLRKRLIEVSDASDDVDFSLLDLTD